MRRGRLAAVAVAVSMLSLTACTSWEAAAVCASPLLVTATGHPEAGGRALHLWEPDGRSTLLDSDVRTWESQLSPDGDTVAMTSPEGEYSDALGYDKSRVALLSLESGTVTPVSADIEGSNVGNLAWSADGSEVAFIRQSVTDEGEIVAVRIEDGTERRLLALGMETAHTFAWSSERRELLIPRYPAPDSSSPIELRRYSVDTGDHVVVDTPHRSIGQLAWSDDGRFVAMSADIPGTGRPRLFVLDVETGNSMPVDRRRGGVRSMIWSGPYLLYTYFVWTPDDATYLMRWDSRSQERERMDRPGWETLLDEFTSISSPRCVSGQ